MPAPLIAAAAKAALHTLAQAATAYAKQRALATAWNWKRQLALALGATIFFAVSLCSGIAAAVQNSTLPWPVGVPAAGKESNGWVAGGWQISSEYGWRTDPFDPQRKEFHDGIDLAGPPFCLHCRVPSLFDAQVRYLGWDRLRDQQPADKSGGGMLVELQTLADEQHGVQAGELVASYAHLATYRLLVQLQGRIEDAAGREEYRPYAEYRELDGELLPAPDETALAISCSSELAERVPEFVAQRTGPGSFVFLYDKPVVAPLSCSIAVTWPQPGDGWVGYVPDDPGAGLQPDTAVQQFSTTIEQGVKANDIAIRFRAYLTAPPPPASPQPYPYPAPGEPQPQPAYPAPAGRAQSKITPLKLADGCARSVGGVVCGWQLAAMEAPPPRSMPASPETAEQSQPRRGVQAAQQAPPDGQCGKIELVTLPAKASDPRMTPDAAAAWYRADASITEALGYAWLRTHVSDIMRPVTHIPTKPNQILESWHKTGRAVDVPQTGRGLRIIQEGAYQRLFVDGVDITSIMIEAGFTRIPSVPQRPEWWHFELRGGMSWQGAMAQLYPISRLKQLYPDLDWSAFACEGPSPGLPGDGAPPQYEAPFPTCTEGVPSWQQRYEELDGCGPPITWDSTIPTLDFVIGHVGLTGSTTGAHLHLGLRQRSGSNGGNYTYTDVCAPPWQPEELRGKQPQEIDKIVYRDWKANCYTGNVDPLDFLPRANAGPPLPLATAAPIDGAPAQLPPPGTEGALLMPVPSGEASPGEYWSPYANNGRFGGGSVLEWLRALLCNWFGNWFSDCSNS